MARSRALDAFGMLFHGDFDNIPPKACVLSVLRSAAQDDGAALMEQANEAFLGSLEERVSGFISTSGICGRYRFVVLANNSARWCCTP